jgi:mono/diheme cytochrome c family protein
VATVILGGDQFNDGTLARWHLAHLGLTLLALASIGLFWWGARTEAKNRPLLWAPVAFAAVLALAAAAPLGGSASPADYTAFDAQVSWYTWPLHGALQMFSTISPGLGWIGSGLLPGLFVGLLLFAPWLCKRVAPKLVQGAVGVLLVLFLVGGIGFAGRFAPLVGNRDPALVAKLEPDQPGRENAVLFAKGRKIFNSNDCSNCHGEDGRQPIAGPNLLGIAQRRGSDPNWYMRFIHQPTSVKPNSMMPAFQKFNQDELRALAEFLIHQK